MTNRTIAIKLTTDCLGVDEYDLTDIRYAGRKHLPKSRRYQKEIWVSTVIFKDMKDNEYLSNIFENDNEIHVSIYQTNDIKNSRPSNIYFKIYHQVKRTDVDEITFARCWNYSDYLIRYPSKDFDTIYETESETDIVTEKDEIVIEIFDVRFVTGHKTGLFDNGLLICDITKGEII